MKELFEYLKKNLKIAAKSVKYNYRKYLAFFAAVLIIEAVLCSLLFSSDCSSVSEKKITGEAYGCHLIIRGLNDSQYAYLKKYSSEYSPGAVFGITETRDSSTSYFERKTDVYITFTGNAVNSYGIFKARYVPSLKYFSDNNKLDTETTPLIDNSGKSASHAVSEAVIPIFAVSFILLTLLYTVRIHNYRFEYGIYMTCGADFRKLSENAIFEMLIVTFSVFPVSAAVGYSLTLAIHGFIAFDAGSLALSLLLSLIISLGAVFFPMLTVSKIYPMKNIVSADNSGYVSSPRLSFEMLGRKFKKHYEPFSLFRFRKFYIKTVLITAAFSSAACTLAYGYGLAKQREKYPSPEFSLEFTDDGYSVYGDELSNEIHSVGNIAYTRLNITEYADELNSHIGFMNGQTKAFTEFASGRQNGISRVYDKVKFNLCTEEELAYLGTFSCDGDCGRILQSGNYAVVNAGIENVRRLALKPGDKIYAAIKDGNNPHSTVTPGDLPFLTGKKLLNARIELYNYRYVELTVVSVINNMPCDEFLEIYLSEDAFRAVVYPPEESDRPTPAGNPFDIGSDEPAAAGDEFDEPLTDDFEDDDTVIADDLPPEDLRELVRTVDIYLSDGLSAEEIKHVGAKLRSVAEDYGGITVKSKNAKAERDILKSMKIPVLCLAISVAVFLIVPIIRLFSQIVFFKKRYPEINMIRALGAVTSEIRHIFITDGVCLSLASGLTTLGFSFVLVRLLYRLMSKAASTNIALGGVAVFYEFSFPTAFCLVAVIGSMITAFVSVYLTYALYLKSLSDAPHSFSEE